MTEGIVRAIFICPIARAPMVQVESVEAIAGVGLKGDRYAEGRGSYNRDAIGKRQVTFINANSFWGSDFTYASTRRNIVTEGVELMYLIGKSFTVGGLEFFGVKYCDPCMIPSKLSGIPGFKERFHELGGLIAEVRTSGLIIVGCPIVSPARNYDE